MRVIVPVAIPGPARAGWDSTAALIHLLKAGTIDAPNIAIAGRQRAAIAQRDKTGPRKRELGCPARYSMDTPAHLDGMSQARKIPVEKTPA